MMIGDRRFDGDNDGIPCESICHDFSTVKNHLLFWHEHLQGAYGKYIVDFISLNL